MVQVVWLPTMKQITLSQAVIDTIRSKKDGSLGLTVSTPELNVAQKTLFFELQGVVVNLNITPIEVNAPEEKINKDLNQKSQSSRLRNVLFVLWNQGTKEVDFETFYTKQMEKLIEHYKSKLDQ